MTEQQNFRTAFNGFNREDVVQYIEEVNAKHAAEIGQLNSDMQYLQEKLTQYESITADDEDDTVSADLEQKIEEQAAVLVEQSDRIAELEQKLAEAQEALQTAESLLEEASAENTRLQDELAAAQVHSSNVRSQQNAELNAYRRAERVERQANERARQINDQVNGALADATTKIDGAAAQITTMTDETVALFSSMAEEAAKHLKQLQLAIGGSKQILTETASALYTIRPAEEE